MVCGQRTPFVRSYWRAKLLIESGYDGASLRREVGAIPFCEVVSCSMRQSVGVLGLDTSSCVVLHGFVIVLNFFFPYWCERHTSSCSALVCSSVV